jgi:hypothetical protein
MLLAALILALSPPADPDVEAVNAATAALDAHLGDFGHDFDRKPGTDRLAEAEWHAIQNWAAHWLDHHPHAIPADLEKAGEAIFEQRWSFSAADLGHSDVLVSANRVQLGNSFILGTGGRGGYHLRWSIAAPQLRLDRDADRLLSWWRASVQNGHCGDDCRTMSGGYVQRLPDAANGAARFVINAGYAQDAGGTVGSQLSFWSWKRGQAQPLLVHSYAYGIEGDISAVLRGSILHVMSKGEWHKLFACGTCGGREIELRFAAEPNRVRMLAPISHTQEVDLIDRVFTRVLKHQPIGALASPAAVRVIRRQLDGPLHETDPELKGFVGMLGGWQRWRTRGQRWACVDADEGGVTAFAFDAGLTRITEARVLKPGSCKGEGPYKY